MALALYDDGSIGSSGAPAPIFTSTNSGTTWTWTTAPSNNWFHVASSADGSTIIAVPISGSDTPVPIYTSTNSGVTWTSNNVLGGWSSVATSADGGKWVAVAGLFNTGTIYTAYSPRSPSLNIATPQTNLVVSWTVPSTNFVLQQKSDLRSTGWTAVTNSPVLNLTNLQNEVVLRRSGSNGFYRLKTP